MRPRAAGGARIGAAVGVLIFGLAAVVWAVHSLPIFWRENRLIDAAQHIIAGERYRPAALEALNPLVEQIKRGEFGSPAARRAAAIIVLDDLERRLASKDRPELDAKMDDLDKAIRLSLVDSPSDAFLWAVFFWLQNNRSGYDASHLKYLRLSYSLGPQEGWVGIKRNRFALAVFSRLPGDLKERAVAEFPRLVESGFHREAADILTGPGWPVREQLLGRLQSVPEVDRQLFARIVFQLGYDVSVPGVSPRGLRPWN